MQNKILKLYLKDLSKKTGIKYKKVKKLFPYYNNKSTVVAKIFKEHCKLSTIKIKIINNKLKSKYIDRK